MTVEETKEYTPEQKARFREEVAKVEEQFGADTFCPDPEHHRQKWQRRKDKILVQIATSNSSEEKEHLQQKLIELEQAWKRSAENLAYLRDLHGLNANQKET